MNNLENNSGEGKNSVVLDIVAKRFNWGAFWFTWIWGLFNKSYWTLIYLGLGIISFILQIFSIFGVVLLKDASEAVVGTILLSVVGVKFLISIICFGLRIYYGIKGNRWAWQNKRWESIQKFHSVQKVWAIVGTVLMGFLCTLCVIGVVAAMTIPSLVSSTNSAKERVVVLKTVSLLSQATLMKEALGEKCAIDSVSVAKCLADQMSSSATPSGNEIIWMSTGDKVTFYIKGNCKSNDGACYVEIQPAASSETEKIGLYVNSDGYIRMNEIDTQKVLDKYKR